MRAWGDGEGVLRLDVLSSVDNPEESLLGLNGRLKPFLVIFVVGFGLLDPVGIAEDPFSIELELRELLFEDFESLLVSVSLLLSGILLTDPLMVRDGLLTIPVPRPFSFSLLKNFNLSSIEFLFPATVVAVGFWRALLEDCAGTAWLEFRVGIRPGCFSSPGWGALLPRSLPPGVGMFEGTADGEVARLERLSRELTLLFLTRVMEEPELEDNWLLFCWFR